MELSSDEAIDHAWFFSVAISSPEAGFRLIRVYVVKKLALYVCLAFLLLRSAKLLNFLGEVVRLESMERYCIHPENIYLSITLRLRRIPTVLNSPQAAQENLAHQEVCLE